MNGLNLGISTFAQTGRAGADRGGAGLPDSSQALPPLMHMGYVGVSRHSMQQAGMCAYPQHKSGW